jgi:hypothetical protein
MCIHAPIIGSFAPPPHMLSCVHTTHIAHGSRRDVALLCTQVSGGAFVVPARSPVAVCLTPPPGDSSSAASALHDSAVGVARWASSAASYALLWAATTASILMSSSESGGGADAQDAYVVPINSCLGDTPGLLINTTTAFETSSAAVTQSPRYRCSGTRTVQVPPSCSCNGIVAISLSSMIVQIAASCCSWRTNDCLAQKLLFVYAARKIIHFDFIAYLSVAHQTHCHTSHACSPPGCAHCQHLVVCNRRPGARCRLCRPPCVRV